MFRFRILFIELSKKMWPKVTLFALLAVASALGSLYLKRYIPDSFNDALGADAVSSILSILASSMLAVTTFSLSTMVAAYGSVTSGVTPRATQLVVQDPTTQNALSVFLGSFLFSLVGIIGLNTGIYEGSGRFVLFLFSLVVVLLILITLIRWIDHLTKLGRMSETTRQVEQAARDSMSKRAKSPCLGGNLWLRTPAAEAGKRVIPARDCGYVQYIDVKELNELGKKEDVDIYLAVLPGTFVTQDDPLVFTTGGLEKEDTLRAAFVIKDERSFEQDPRFGLCVLAEVAQRALCDVSDTGTAIDIVGRLLRVLAEYKDVEFTPPGEGRVWVPPLNVEDMFEDAFQSLCRDSAGLFQVQSRLLKALASLHRMGNAEFRKSAARFSALTLLHMERSDMLEEEKDVLRLLAVPEAGEKGKDGAAISEKATQALLPSGG